MYLRQERVEVALKESYCLWENKNNEKELQ